MSPESACRLEIARRVAHAHAAAGDAATLVALESGSTVEDPCDERSDVDMGILWPVLPSQAALREACTRAGGQPWHWSPGELAEGAMGVAFRVDGIETQIGCSTLDNQEQELDGPLARHEPDTPNHKPAEGLLKALGRQRGARTLAGPVECFSRAAGAGDGRARALAKSPTPWRAVGQIVHRDAALWCREIVVEAGYRLLLALAGLNRRCFTRLQVKRMHRFADGLAIASERFAERLEALLVAPPAKAFAQLHRLEGEVIELASAQWPALDLEALRVRRAAFTSG